ncbi:TPA: hypothetical protein P2I16_001506 [Aeromonas salmonicida]|uniref:hypothetical protein n=1 Tax=Aeromonas salmonicida TaxID=645 RepID=UPI003312D16F|nr:hypothetical protein [Aeromonas salmonicida]
MLAGLAQCHDLGQEEDYSAGDPVMTIYLGLPPFKISEEFIFLNIKFNRLRISLYMHEKQGFLFWFVLRCRDLK